MKNLIVLLIVFTFFEAKAFTLSPEAEISILTCSPGNELYSLFGHTAIRINDPQQGTDIVFNYGTFDFATPHFYLKYARGLLPYQLSVTTFPAFFHSYQRENRTVYSQTLRLDSLQKQELFDLLLENRRPENRSYLYNFLYDNCTTRSRDIVLKSLSDTVSWNIPVTDKSFWNLLDEYLQASPWVQWGIHTILGQGGNRKATALETMFLPDYLMYGLDTAYYHDQRLAGNTEVLFRAKPVETSSPWYFTPLFVFTFGVVLLLFLIQKTKNKILFNTLALIFLLFTSLIGCLIVFLGGFTAHPITAPNWNILWANPLNLIVIPFVFTQSIPQIIRLYLKIYLALLAIAIPAWIIAQPAVPLASLPLIVFMIYVSCKLRLKKYA